MTDITKKQYLLSSCKRDLGHMQEHRVAGHYLYTGSQLNISACETADGKRVILLGNAFCTDRVGKRAEEDVASFSGEDIAAMTRYWTGRWVLITETTLVTDAAGLMGAFYGKTDDGWVASSSLAVLARVLDRPLKEPVKADGITWQVLPESRLPDVKALICTQRLCFADGHLQTHPHIWMWDRRLYSTQEKCKAVADMLVCGLQNIHAFSGKSLTLALTGGKDSRLTFSALLRSGVPFSAYTAEHQHISHADQTVPKKLAERFGIPYHYIKRERVSVDLLDDYTAFTAGNSNGVDAQFYARGQFARIPGDTVVIRSGLFEAGQTYSRGIAGANEASFIEGMTSYYADLRDTDCQGKAFNAWMDIVRANPVDYVDIRDRFYIEQRVGGWAAAIEQSLDINDFTSIQIANCAELLSVLLSCNEDERTSLALSYETLKRLEPKTLEFPVNRRNVTDHLSRVMQVLRHPVQKVRKCIRKR